MRIFNVTVEYANDEIKTYEVSEDLWFNHLFEALENNDYVTGYNVDTETE